MAYDNSGGSKFGFGVLVGMIAGAIAGLMLAPKSGKETRKDVANKLQELKDEYQKGELQNKVRDIFGNIKSGSMQTYQQAKNQVQQKVSQAKGQINKGQYDKIVEDVINGLKDTGQETSQQLQKLRDNLESDWADIQKNRGVRG